MMSAESPVTVGHAIDVPHIVVYPPLDEHDVTPPSLPSSHPGALMSGLILPSSVGPHDEKLVMDSSFELSAPTVM